MNVIDKYLVSLNESSKMQCQLKMENFHLQSKSCALPSSSASSMQNKGDHGNMLATKTVTIKTIG